MLKPVQQALRILMWQAGWAVLGATAFELLVSRQWAYSVLVGAGIGMLGLSYLVLIMVKQGLQITRPATLFTVLSTWLIKTMLVVGLLLIAFRASQLVPLAVILGLIGSLIAYWCSVFFVRG